MIFRLMNSTALWAPADGGAAAPAAAPAPTVLGDPAAAPAPAPAADPAAAAPPADPAAPPADPAAPPAGGTPPAPEWKEYEDDPAKTPEENAALKAEHDKTRPEPDFDATVPESYDDLQMPDGIEVDKDLLAAMTPVLKDLYITKPQAEALVGAFAPFMQQRAQAEAEQFTQTVDSWAETARTEHGANWDKVAQAGASLVSRFGDDEVRTFLNQSGAGNHPAMIRMFARVGELIGEDVPDPANLGGSSKPAEAAHLLYANDAPKG